MTSAFVTDLVVRFPKTARDSHPQQLSLLHSREKPRGVTMSQQTKGLDFAFCGVCDT